MPLPEWLHVKSPLRELPLALVTHQHHAGERSALALAQEIPGSLLVLDDAPARQLAALLHLTFTGTVGILILAKARGRLPLLRRVLAELRAAGMWLAESVVERACREAGE
ncbi:DUF3368 domain-containing protein [Hymenobacter baengnokdamensis]|uniref:DUF3368 domain-containing protein n=1 Tax=Hymenobacter baengnokdamensis TaxID=2615203 RepID=UPI0037429B6E